MIESILDVNAVEPLQISITDLHNIGLRIQKRESLVSKAFIVEILMIFTTSAWVPPKKEKFVFQSINCGDLEDLHVTW